MDRLAENFSIGRPSLHHDLMRSDSCVEFSGQSGLSVLCELQLVVNIDMHGSY